MERELLLLGLLRQGNMHGYRLNEFIERDMPALADIKKPTAYALLDKMEGQGWIIQRQEQEGNRPPRRTYQITHEGETQFQRLLRDNLKSFHAVKFHGDIGLAFLDEVPHSEAVSLLQQRRIALEQALASLQGTPVHQGSLQYTIEHLVFHLINELQWLDGLIDRLSQKL